MNTTKNERLALAESLIGRGYDPLTPKATPGVLVDFAAELGVTPRTLQRCVRDWLEARPKPAPVIATAFWDVVDVAAFMRSNRGWYGRREASAGSAVPDVVNVHRAAGSRPDWHTHRARCSDWQARFLPLTPYGRAWVADRLTQVATDPVRLAPYRRPGGGPAPDPAETDRLMRAGYLLELERSKPLASWADRRVPVTIADMRRTARTLVASVHLARGPDGVLRKKLVNPLTRFMTGAPSYPWHPWPVKVGATWARPQRRWYVQRYRTQKRRAVWRALPGAPVPLVSCSSYQPITYAEFEMVLRADAARWKAYDLAAHRD